MRIVASLKSKIIIAVSAILAVTIGLGTWINLGYQRANMEKALEENVLVYADTIEHSLASAMVEGKSREVGHLLGVVGGYHNIQEVMIFSPNGVVLKSSKSRMIGRKVDAVMEKSFLSNQYGKLIKRRDEGIFSVLFPIHNEERCFRCHGSKVALNGILAVNISMAQTQENVRKLSKTMFLWALGVTAILAVSLSLFLTHFVSNPILELISTMERAESGLEARMTVKSSDEIGRLTEAFNSLLMKLELAHRKVERYHYEQMKRADRLASIGEMAAGIAHEIKNPLAGIAGVIQVLGGDPSIDEKKKTVLSEVLAQVERMDKAVRNLLSFARPQEPKMTFVDVNELIDRLLDFLGPQFAKNVIITERKLSIGLPWLMLDPDLLQQALINIALNAIQAMPEGGTFSVETKSINPADGNPGSVEIAFTDTGKGISGENLNKIFSPFFTTRQQGTGLGLSITQRIIEQHGGNISVTSTPGKGAIFTIVLPLPKGSIT